jgi:hypothetical protein
MTHTTRKSITFLLLAAAAMGFCLARAEKSSGNDGWRRFPGDLGRIVRFLDLSEEDQQRLLKLLERQEESRKAMEATHAQKLKEIEARRNALREQMKPIQEQLKPFEEKLAELDAQERGLRGERWQAQQVREAEIEAFFTPAQRFAYEKHELARAVIHRYKAAKLDERQAARVNALAEAALMEINSIEVDDRRERERAEREIHNRLNRQVFDEVLTEENQIAVQTIWLYYEVGRNLHGIRLNEDQLKQLRELCRPRVVAWRKAPKKQQKKAWQETITEATEATMRTILTDEQRAKLKK